MEEAHFCMELLPEERLSGLEYRDDIVLLCNDTQFVQLKLNQLAIRFDRYDM